MALSVHIDYWIEGKPAPRDLDVKLTDFFDLDHGETPTFDSVPRYDHAFEYLKTKPSRVVSTVLRIRDSRTGRTQKKRILQANRDRNAGVLRSDKSGQKLVPPQQSRKGMTPPHNEAHVDHIKPRSKGGPNTMDNAQVLSREDNLMKSDKWP